MSEGQRTHYCTHLQLEKLLRLQPRAGQFSNVDHPFFVLALQVNELWLKQLILEIGSLIAVLDADNVGRGIWLAQRAAQISTLLIESTRILESVAAPDFIAMRSMRISRAIRRAL